ncbi:hypothetical protein GCM10007301_33790 [Azorhizobium oxalatiphilum]|uniref:VOC domain-containing protein n=1 Tax=Azorhizobium oxalatiphilum TaxID=980631 RepID=A0A917C5P1_9HYPH|nr:VOC family protein [Azorhizobium oxalatiphilum]GGF71292.1 hypothetical protein GCM10007301_33790 [Azorhizobium oxalatiphilum]
MAHPLIETTGIDHAGINVPDADEAAAFFEELFGTRVISDMRPGAVDGEWKRRFRWHPSAEIRRIVMLEVRDGSKIELFEYSAPDAAEDHPHGDDPGANHVAFKAADPEKAIAALKARGLSILNDPLPGPAGSLWFYFLTPWGSQLELVFPAQ